MGKKYLHKLGLSLATTALLAVYTGGSLEVQAAGLNGETIQEEVYESEVLSGWIEENGTYFYYNDQGKKETGWLEVGKNWYYMNADGVMQTGWTQVGKNWYYMTASGRMKTGWTQVGKNWYYMTPSGRMKTGWTKVGNNWYYMSASGAMQTGWTQVGKTWYYMMPSGAMNKRTGWNKIGGKWYYQLPSGAMDTGWRKVGNNWYYLQDNAVMKTGWMKLGGKTYYMNSSGVMQTGKVYIDGKQQSPYYFSANGALDLERGAGKPGPNSGLTISDIPIKNPSFIPTEAILINRNHVEQVYIYEKEFVGGGKINKVYIEKFSEIAGYETWFKVSAGFVDEVGKYYLCSIGINDNLVYSTLIGDAGPAFTHGQSSELKDILLDFKKAYMD